MPNAQQNGLRAMAQCNRCGRIDGVNNFVRRAFGYDFLCRQCIPEAQAEEMERIVRAEMQPAAPQAEVKVNSKFISKSAGEYITSKRKFGVEYEVNLDRNGQINLRDSIVREFQLVHDGSVNNGIEIVSPILGGASGEERLKEVCVALKKVGADADDSCGFHVHLDAADFFDRSSVRIVRLSHALKYSQDKALANYKYYILDSTTIKDLKTYNAELYDRVLNRGELDSFSYAAFNDYYATLDKYQVVFSGEEKQNRKLFSVAVPRSSRGSRLPLNEKLKDQQSIVKYKGEPCMALVGYNQFAVIDPVASEDVRVIMVDRERDNQSQEMVERLKRVAAFYLAFDDVIASMLPADRRDNEFTKRVNTRISIADITRVRNVLDFFNVWTKTKSLHEFRNTLGENRHESRYYGVNFRALLKHGTIEIRYHAGTTDAKKTLNWVALHQAIVDIAADLNNPRFNLDRLEKAGMIIDLDRKTDLFFKKLGLQDTTQSYIRARIKKFQKEDGNLVDTLITEDN